MWCIDQAVWNRKRQEEIFLRARFLSLQEWKALLPGSYAHSFVLPCQKPFCYRPQRKHQKRLTSTCFVVLLTSSRRIVSMTHWPNRNRDHLGRAKYCMHRCTRWLSLHRLSLLWSRLAFSQKVSRQSLTNTKVQASTAQDHRIQGKRKSCSKDVSTNLSWESQRTDLSSDCRRRVR